MLQTDPALRVDTTKDGDQALQRLLENNYSVLITDLRMPRLDGMQLLKEVQRGGLPVTVIVTTGYGSIDDAVQAIRMGAYDFLTKPIDVDNLRLVLQRALPIAPCKMKWRCCAPAPESLPIPQCAQQESAHARSLRADRQRRPYHDHCSDRGRNRNGQGAGRPRHPPGIGGRTGPLIAVNCAALPENLLESELFGHEKGSFTSAIATRKGRFELADGGTMFLDEVGDVPPAMQAKLLRVLQERQIERVGGQQAIEVDVA